MKYRPIIFSVPMVRAIREGRKTQTRRIIKPQQNSGPDGQMVDLGSAWGLSDGCLSGEWKCPYGKPGDRLYVKEAAWMWCEKRPNGKTKTGCAKWHYVPLESAPIFYVADGHKPSTKVVSPDTGNEWGWRFKVARFMPRSASRITLEVTEVRVQRLQEISEEDAVAEGFDGLNSFAHYWTSLNGLEAGKPFGWNANPFICAITFKDVSKETA